MVDVGRFFVVAMLVAGCGPRTLQPPTSPDRALVFGNIIIDEDYVPNCIVLRSDDGGSYDGFTYDNGNFFVENLPPGKYVVAWFCLGRDLFAVTTAKNWDEHLFVVGPADVRFLGSWRVTTDRGFFSSDFTIVLLSKPHPWEILQGIRHHVAGTEWDQRIAAAMGMPTAPPPPPPTPTPTPGAPPSGPATAPAPEPAPSKPRETPSAI